MNAAISITESVVKRTRKPHSCCECGYKMPAGSACMVVRGIWQDGPSAMYWCLLCQMIRNNVKQFLDPKYDEPLCYGELLDFAHEVSR